MALHGGTKPVHWTATIYPGPKGNFVFNASTIFWAQGLSPARRATCSPGPTGPAARPRRAVQQITHNLLRRKRQA